MEKRYKHTSGGEKSLNWALNALSGLFCKFSKVPFSTKKAVVPLLALLFSPVGIVILVILALLVFGILGFAVFLTFNLLTIGGFILIIGGLIAVIRGNLNMFTLWVIIIGVALLILPKLIEGLSRFTLAAVLG